MAANTTYSLAPDDDCADGYYLAVAALADRWEVRAREIAGELVEEFRAFRRVARLPDQSFAERAFELLVVGVLLREHGVEAARLPAWLAWPLRRLAEAQDAAPWADRPIKTARGLLGGLARRTGTSAATGRDVWKLVAWLRAQGEGAVADRLAVWGDYFDALAPRSARDAVSRCLVLADAFAAESLTALGQYTPGVERFLAEEAPRHRWRHDAALVNRSRLEYHLAMLGTEVLSRAYRERFIAAPRKVVVLPTCMRARSAGQCRAKLTHLGWRCQQCAAGCGVRWVTELGEREGFEVYVLPDDLRSLGLGACSAIGGVGVVGVSCVLTNWSAGWQVDAAGVPAQGLLLDCAGCRSHWGGQGAPTRASLKKLRELISAGQTADSSSVTTALTRIAGTRSNPGGSLTAA
jgi:hypothetical protein